MEKTRAACDAIDTGTREPFRNIVWEAFTPGDDDEMRCIFGGKCRRRRLQNGTSLQ